jgi:molecular chaperone GrpE
MADLSEERKQEPKPSKIEPTDSLEEARIQLEEIKRMRDESDRKAADYLNRLQRLQADMENLQKITKRQIETVTKQASEGLLLKLLPILDALQQAANIAHTNNQLPKEEIAVGLKMLLKQLADVLQTEGLEEIPAVGHQLDPSKHEVVNSVEKDDVPEGTIIEEVRKGYMLNGKVIRPSLVAVSRPKPTPETEQASEEQ